MTEQVPEHITRGRRRVAFPPMQGKDFPEAKERLHGTDAIVIIVQWQAFHGRQGGLRIVCPGVFDQGKALVGIRYVGGAAMEGLEKGGRVLDNNLGGVKVQVE